MQYSLDEIIAAINTVGNELFELRQERARSLDGTYGIGPSKMYTLEEKRLEAQLKQLYQMKREAHAAQNFKGDVHPVRGARGGVQTVNLVR